MLSLTENLILQESKRNTTQRSIIPFTTTDMWQVLRTKTGLNLLHGTNFILMVTRNSIPFAVPIITTGAGIIIRMVRRRNLSSYNLNQVTANHIQNLKLLIGI